MDMLLSGYISKFLASRHFFCLYCILLWATAGCGPSGPEIAPVSGTVRIDGQPLTAGQVTFVPAQGPSAFGEVDRDGHFVLTTKNPGDGAVVGEHQVSITPIAEGRSLDSMQQGQTQQAKLVATPIPARYHAVASSGVTQQVKRGKNEMVIELTSR